jgi:flagellar basal-body rod protein FlgB
MSNGMPTLVGGLADAMRHLSERQRLIAGNIANSETPGFRAQEIDSPDFGALVDASAGRPGVARPTVTLSAGMTALGASGPRPARQHDDRNLSEVKPDGNTVTLEDQLLKMGQVQSDFAAMTAIYRKSIALMRTAAGRGGSGG